MTLFLIISWLCGVVFYGLRRFDCPVFGYEVGLVNGSIPVECLIWGLSISVLAVQDVRSILGV
jgi:hypothetical protein